MFITDLFQNGTKKLKLSLEKTYAQNIKPHNKVKLIKLQLKSTEWRFKDCICVTGGTRPRPSHTEDA